MHPGSWHELGGATAMGLLSELRVRGRHVIGPAVGICAIGYFAYHVVNGDRGLIAWRSLEQRVEVARTQLAEIKAEREILEQRVRLLHPESLDPDMLDEWARRVLNYGLPDETVIFTPPSEQR